MLILSTSCKTRSIENFLLIISIELCAFMGLIIHKNSNSWNPLGTGQKFVGYRGGAWVLLG